MGVANLIMKTENVELKEAVQKLTEKVNTLFQKQGALEKRVCRCEGKKTMKVMSERTPPSDNSYTRKAKYRFTCCIQPWHYSDKCKLGAPGHKKEAIMTNKIVRNETNHMILKK